jgi:hypothetical protein
MEGIKLVESLIQEVEELERSTAEKREQQAFIVSLIEEKQRQCQQAREQHQEKIRALAHQARKASRARKAQGSGRPGSAITAGVTGVEPPRGGQENNDGSAGNAATIDLALIDKALGERRRRHLLGGEAGQSDAVKTCDSNSLEAVKQALEERLQSVRDMSTKLRDALGPPGDPNSKSLVHGSEEFNKLEAEVSALLNPDGVA